MDTIINKGRKAILGMLGGGGDTKYEMDYCTIAPSKKKV
jgi:hypothetical protein